MAPLLPTLAAHARSILSSATTTRNLAVQTATTHLSHLGPLAARAILLARDDDDDNKDKDKSDDPQIMNPSIGVTDPNDINNTFIFVLFGLIGVAFVVTGIWFFFWAKNGGFYFKEDDWDDYKSTVLRRKGPNGTLLSGATPSTNLGGGSVYRDVDDGKTEYTGGLTQLSGDTGDTMSTLTGITAGASDIAGRERRRRLREKKEREHEKRRDRKNRKKSGRKVGEDGVLVDEEAEEDAKQNLRAYRAERPARVGGLNKEAEGSEWEGSTNPEMSTVSGGTATDLLMSGRQATPTSTPRKERKERERREKEREKREKKERKDKGKSKSEAPSEAYDTATEMTYDTGYTEQQSQSNNEAPKKKAGGIRKVYSTADRTTSRENERLRAEARRFAEKGRAAASSVSGSSSAYGTERRDFSYQRADLRHNGNTIPEEQGETGSLMGRAGRYLLPSTAEESDQGTGDIADGGDFGTKSYKHYIPGISSEASASAVGSSVDGSEYTEDRRERRRRRDAERAARANQKK